MFRLTIPAISPHKVQIESTLCLCIYSCSDNSGHTGLSDEILRLKTRIALLVGTLPSLWWIFSSFYSNYLSCYINISLGFYSNWAITKKKQNWLSISLLVAYRDRFFEAKIGIKWSFNWFKNSYLQKCLIYFTLVLTKTCPERIWLYVQKHVLISCTVWVSIKTLKHTHIHTHRLTDRIAFLLLYID